MRFFIFASLLSLAAVAFAVPNPLPGSSDVVVRDPAIWYNPDSKKYEYFVFSTANNIRIFTSTSLLRARPARTLNLDLPTGSLVLGPHDNVYAPGGQSPFRDPRPQHPIRDAQSNQVTVEYAVVFGYPHKDGFYEMTKAGRNHHPSTSHGCTHAADGQVGWYVSHG